MKKRLLSLALVLVMVLSLLPATAVTALAAEEGEDDSGTKDAFGITMTKWTPAEKAAAEADLPFGTGYGTWTTLLEKNELFFSMGYDNKTRLTGMFDWNGTEGTEVSTIVNAVDNFGQSKLTSKEESYKAVATAAMDLNGTGKKEYVANLALNASGNTLYLYVTDSNNNRVAGTSTFINVGQLSSMEVHQLNGAFSIAAGDFDGDGTDTVVVYVPNANAPFIKEYSFTVSDSGVSCTEKSTVAANVLTMLCNNGIKEITTMKNQPMVDLVAEDVDKDGFDELIITGGMNDVTTTNDKNLGSQLFIYDRTSSGWNKSYWSGTENDRQIRITSNSNRRIVWASSTVGNIVVSTSTTSVDYPEIVTAGFVDNDSGEHINVDNNDKVGVQVVRVTDIKDKGTKNVICEYGVVFNQEFSPNGWTKGGFYEKEDVNGLLQVQAYADRGLGQAESVFISGSVYRINDNSNGLEHKYKHGDFNSKDDFAPGGRTLTNTTVTAVTAGNFDGNDEGREQLIFVTTLKQSGKNNAYSRVYCYYAEDDGTCNSKRSNYLTEHKGSFYVSLAALDTDNDSIIAKLESIERDYSAPDVLAILEASPYFAEINDSFGNSETTYGKASSSGDGTTNRFGFTLGVSVGYEFESDLAQSGGGFELALDRSFNWATANTTTVEWFTEFRNDSGENLVVVYRCPVVTYQYVDTNGKELVVEKVGQPATSMITVDEYNEASDQYDSLEPIDETNANLGDAGDPFSYRSKVDETTMKNAVVFNGAGEGKWDSAGWTQYSGSGSVMQGLTITKEQEKTFSFDLDVSLNVFAKAAGVTASRTFGFTYGYEQTHISGSSVTKSGAVTGAQVAGYDFQWKFAAWNCTLNGSTVPVLGYLVKDVVAPPSPAMGLTAESITTDSVTLRWSSGTRDADQYRIYRVRDTAPQYVLVGAVQGDETSFQLTGLKPGETYTYVVRGVGFTKAGEAVESVDSAPITVRTQSEDSKVTLSLHSSSLTGSTLQSTGAAADLSVQVTGTSSGSLYYQWQLLEAEEAGVKHGWLSVNTLAGDTVGTVTGATSGSLTLKNIDKSLDGSYLRCVVTANSPAGDVETYYSPVVTLDLSGRDTTTEITVTGKTGGSGSVSDPYTGMANYTTVENQFNGSYINVPATVEKDGKTYTIYKDATDAENPVCVGVYDEVNTETGTSSRTYYAVNKTGENYTLDYALTPADDRYLTDGGNSFDTTGYTDFDGTVSTHEGNYEKRYVVGSGSPITLAEYWYNISDGQYYTKTESGFALANPQPDKDADGNATDADLRMVYYEAAGTVILSADGDDSYDHYQVYTADGSGYTAGASFYRLPGTKLYKSGATAPYADSAKLTTVTVQQEVFSTVTTSVSGTQLNLSASVVPSGGTISFTITNTDTGTVTQLTTTSGTGITWRAPKAGLYRIVATAAATATTKSSSAVCYYRADDPNSNYRLTVKQGDDPVTNISYDGSSVTLVLEQRANSESPWSAVTNGVSYTVSYQENNTTCGSTYTPNAAGSYTFSAVVNNKTVATAMLVVNKVPIIVTPTWDKPAGAANTVPAYSDIGLVFTDAQGNRITGLDDYMYVSCDLYNGTSIKQDAPTGVYTVTPTYVSGTMAEFLSRYNVTINTDKIYYFSDAITVYFSAGENGDAFARYIDPSGTEFSFSDGSQISMDYGLKFVAEPADGWSVDTWKVTAGDKDVTSCFSRYIDTLLITSGKMNTLKEEMGSSKTLNVLVTFTNQTHKITYDIASGSGNGSLRAEADNVQLLSGACVASDATVTFTATPVAGQTMVEKWIVDGKEYKWDGTNAPYRENTLTLKNIAADHDVKVSFTDVATTDVEVSAVEASSYVPYTNATVTVTDAQGNTLEGDALKSVSRSGALTFTAAINNSSSAVIKEWQTKTSANGTWTTVTGSGGKDAITIYEHGANLHVRVVIAVTQTYELSWKIMEGKTEITDTNIANLTAKSGAVDLTTSGGSYAANIPVTFTLVLSDAYELVGWSDNVTPAEDNKSAALTLTGNTTVTVTVAKKPVVTISNSPANGSVTYKATKNGIEQTLSESSYVDPGTDLTVTLSPAKGYEVGTITGYSPAFTDGTGDTTDDKTYTISDVQANQTITAVWSAIPQYSVTYSVVDTNDSAAGGINGTLAAAVSRKGLDTYKDDSFTGGNVCLGSTVTFTATPDDGYRVKEWKVDGVVQKNNGVTDISKTLTLTNLSKDAVVTVEFMQAGNSVTASAGDNGKITSAVVGGSNQVQNIGTGITLTEGASIELTAQPNAGYEVEKWIVNSVDQPNSSSNTFTYTAQSGGAGAVITVTFRQVNYTVTWGGTNGTVTADGYEGTSADIRGGTNVTFTAAPSEGYVLSGWKINNAEVTASTEGVSMNGMALNWTVPNGKAATPAVSSYEVKASFTRDSYAVTVDKPTNGTITANAADLTAVTSDTAVTFTAKPDQGYILIGWTVNGVTTDTRSLTHTVTVTQPTTVTAILVPSHYTVTGQADTATGGTVTVSGSEETSASVAYGESITFTAKPADYYHVSGWKVDGTLQDGTANQNTFTLNNVTKAHTVTAVFEAAIRYDVYYSVDGTGGTLSAQYDDGTPLVMTSTSPQPVWGGSKLVFTAAPQSGKMVAQWQISTDNGKTWTTITRDNLAAQKDIGVSMDHYLSNTLTVTSLGTNLYVKVSFTTYNGFAIPGNGEGYTVTPKTCNPAEPYAGAPAGEVRENGDVSFTVSLAGEYSNITKLIINGYDCIAGKLTEGKTAPDNCLSVAAVKNANGSYTVTITGVTDAISAAIEAHKVVVGNLVVPAAFTGIEDLNSVDKIQAKLETKLTASSDGKVFYDIALKYREGDRWVEVTEENFPANGVDVVLPYPTGADGYVTSSKDTFTIVHMLTVDKDGKNPGDLEVLSYTKETDGLHFHVDSLSPFGVSWTKYTAPSGGGGGGGGAIAPAETVVIKDSVNGKVTADNKAAAKGDTVTLTVTPDKGYTLETLIVTDKNGSELKLTEKDGKYTFTMPASNVTVKATFMEDNSMLNFFVDVPADAYYYDAVLWAVENDITSGVDETHFAPNATCTRAQAVTFLWRAAGSPEPESSEMTFTDVAEGSYYHDAVLWAVENGITKGTSDTTFSPDATCSRGQIVTFLWRSLESPDAGGANPFTDVAADAYYADAVLWAVENGITTGTADTTFSPNDDCTRAQIVTFLWRALAE